MRLEDGDYMSTRFDSEAVALPFFHTVQYICFLTGNHAFYATHKGRMMPELVDTSGE